MAGRGPARGANPNRKDPSQRARRNSEPDLRVISAQAAAQPALPDSVEWHAMTVSWWAMWGRSPLAAEFTENDWSELLDTAVLHSKFWSGSTSVAAELRLRVAKFGATPEDRARLQITFAQANGAEPAQEESGEKPNARERYSGLKLAE